MPVFACVNRAQSAIEHEQIAVAHVDHAGAAASAFVAVGEALEVRVEMHGVMQQRIWKRKVGAELTVVFRAEVVQSRKNFTKTPFKPRVKRRAEFLGYGHIDESPVRIDGRIPATVRLIDPDAHEQTFHGVSVTDAFFVGVHGPVRAPTMTGAATRESVEHSVTGLSTS